MALIQGMLRSFSISRIQGICTMPQYNIQFGILFIGLNGNGSEFRNNKYYTNDDSGFHFDFHDLPMEEFRYFPTLRYTLIENEKINISNSFFFLSFILFCV